MARKNSRSLTLSITAIILIKLLVSTVTSSNLSEDAELSRNSDYKQCIKLSREVSGRFPVKSNIHFLGQSLSWVGKVLELSYFRPPATKIQYIPFSGNFLRIVKINQGTFFYTSRNCKLPTEAEVKKYRMLLGTLGLSPKNILMEYSNQGRKTVIADYVYSGRGLASFLYVLYNWATEEKVDLTNALQVYVMRYKKQLYDFDVKVLVINNNYRVVPEILDTEMYVLIQMANPEINDSFERLVPYYPHHHWNEPLPEFDQVRKRRVEDITRKMTEYVGEFFNNENAVILTSTTMKNYILSSVDNREVVDSVELVSVSFEVPSTSSGIFGFVISSL